MSSIDAVRLAVSSFLARTVPDRRTLVCDVSVNEAGTSHVVSGVVSSEDLKTGLFEFLARYPSVDREASTLRVLASVEERGTAMEGAVPVRARPDADAEQVTQVLYGDDVSLYDHEGAWRRVGVPDGYVGWVRDGSVGSAVAIEADAVLVRPVTAGPDGVERGDDEGESTPLRLPIGAPCTVIEDSGDEAHVRFRTGLETSVSSAAITSTDEPVPRERIVDVASRFMGTEYEWGGMTTSGIDCSGLVWVSYRQCGVALPRDADQQRLVGREVSRSDLAPSDLLFFPGHVAISLGGSRYLHAHGASDGVVRNSLDPADDAYLADLDEDLACCRRLLEPLDSLE